MKDRAGGRVVTQHQTLMNRPTDSKRERRVKCRRRNGANDEQASLG